MRSAIPLPTELPVFAPPSYTRTQLSNGLDILLVRKPQLPVFDLQLVVRGGASSDAPLQSGRTSMLAEMLDEGTQRRSALEISTLVEQLGGDLEIRAGWDACVLSCHGLSGRLDALLELLAELVLQPSFPAAEFLRKREERLHALLQERDEPRAVAGKALARAVFGLQHPFGWPLAGTCDTVNSLDPSALTDAYKASFRPAHCHLIAAGDLDPDRMLGRINGLLGSWTGAPVRAVSAPPVPESSAGIYLIDRPGAAQSELRFGHTGTQRNTPDYFPLLVLNTVLGGSFRSRLNLKLREEKGFTYGASTSFSFRRAGGLFTGGAAVFTDVTAQAIELSVAEIQQLREAGVGAEELTRARNYLALGFIRNFETTADIASQLADLALYDLPGDYLVDYPARIAAVTAAEVARVAQRYLHPDRLRVVVVGDRGAIGDALHRLDYGPIHDWAAE